MLIVGDYPYKQSIDNDSEAEAIEIIVSPDKKDALFTELMLPHDLKGTTLGKDMQMYDYRGKRYVIITATDNAYLRILMNANLAENNLRMATPAINYAYLWYQVNLNFYDTNSWIRIAKQIKTLKPYFYKSYITRKSQFKLLSCGERIAKNFISKAAFVGKPYEALGALKYSRYDILAAMGIILNSPYKRLTIPGTLEFFNKGIFDKYHISEKRVAVLEMIYLHVINEYFIPTFEFSNGYPPLLKWHTLFNDSIKDIYTSNRTNIDYIQDFILDNVEDLQSSFRPQLLQNFITSEKEGKLTPLKTWNTNGTL